mgnify:CR=1 FL=1
MVIWIGLLWGCLPPQFDLTHIDDLQIVAVQVDPPAMAPGLDVVLTMWVADPRRRGADVLLYTCSNVEGDSCIEGQSIDGLDPQPLSSWAAVGALTGNQWSVNFQLPQDDIGLFDDEFEVLETLLFALACEPGACEIIDRVAANPPPGTDAYQTVVDMFADPDSWIADLPRDTSSLAVKTVGLQKSTSVSNQNPRVTLDGSPSRLTAAWGDFEPIDMVFNIFDGGNSNFDVRAYSTLGSVPDISPSVASAGITWDPGTMVGDGELFVVVGDKGGGIGVGVERVSVRP